MLFNKLSGFEYQLGGGIGNKDSNQQRASRKYYKLHVWKTESLTIEVKKHVL